MSGRRAWERTGGALASGAALAALAVGIGFVLPVTPAQAQTIPGIVEPRADAEMFLEADELVYNDADQTVTAIGRVRIFYDGYTVDADRVVYDQARSRVIATGNVVLVEPSGNVLRATSADLSDTLVDGFVDALEVETPDQTYFTARRATRRDGSVTVFEDGTYTACPACEENPERPRTWMLNAERITYDQAEQMVYYRNVRLDFLGVPIGWLPFFAHADPTVDRKTGFLTPSAQWDDDLGAMATIPYYIALAPHYDLTLTPTLSSVQGLHMRAEWRQRFTLGEVSVRPSGIYQLDPDVFAGEPGDREWRGGLASNGLFRLNPRWTTGWNLYLQSDRRYFADYEIEAEGANEVVSDLFLTGLHERSWFDARVQRIEVTDRVDQDQPWALPVIDYDRRFSPAALGGELALRANVASLVREDDDVDGLFLNGAAVATPVYDGLEGQYQRASVDARWRRQFIGPVGQVLTPTLGFRGDAIHYDLEASALANAAPTLRFTDTDDALFRAMPYAALEWRWPILMQAAGSSHIIEPIAQIIARPDATHVGQVPVEDSQSLVFDATNLFDLDKFSGFDQLEGGVRANVGARYTGVFGNGLTLSALVGQSFHIAGENPYARTTQVLNEADSGLETDRSDYVAMLSARLGHRFALTASGRFDETDFSLRRGEVISAAAVDRVSGSLTYGYLAAQPARGLNDDQHQITGTAAVRVTDTWRISGSLRYDLDENHVLGIGAGLAYADECFDIALTYSQTSARVNDGDTDHRLLLSVSLRTIGGAQTQILDDSAFDRLLGTR